jgi:protein-arginine kinase activator protein McsA
LQCERCGEREAEVHQTTLIRTGEAGEAHTQHLCKACASVDPAAWQAGLDQLLKSGENLTPEQLGALKGLADMLRQLRPDSGSDSGSSHGKLE